MNAYDSGIAGLIASRTGLPEAFRHLLETAVEEDAKVVRTEMLQIWGERPFAGITET